MAIARTRIIQLNIVLLDADVIIDLHRFGVWEQIIKKNRIIIPSTILRQEVYFFEDDHGRRHNIDLLKDAGIKFQEVSIEATTIREFIKQFERNIQEELHPGELEALSIIQNEKDYRFCTSDKVAIKALALVGSSTQGISYEELLKTSGLTKKLERKHTDTYFKNYLREGSIMRIQSGKIK
jgi:hypothetical protein